MYVDYLKIWRTKLLLWFLPYGKNNAQSHHMALRYLYSIAQIWAIQLSNMSCFLNSKHLSKILLQQRPRILKHQG